MKAKHEQYRHSTYALKYITREKLKRSLEVDIHWNLFHQRVFIENLLNKRFNFFAYFYSIIIALSSLIYCNKGGLSLPFKTATISGILLLIIVWMSLFRIYLRLTILLHSIYIYSDDENSIMNLTNVEFEKYPWYIAGLSGNVLVGVIIPCCCFISLVVFTLSCWNEPLD
jgi:hypothetical protein